MNDRVICYLDRIRSYGGGSGGEFVLTDEEAEPPKKLVLFTVERPWLDNKPYLSCIPAGVYVVKKRDGSNKSLKYPDSWEVMNVNGRSGIVFHTANHPHELYGCIAPNLALLMDSKAVRGYHSMAAIDEMNKFLSDAEVNEFTLIIE